MAKSKTGEKLMTVNFRERPAFVAKAHARAAKDDTTLSRVLRTALRVYVGGAK